MHIFIHLTPGGPDLLEKLNNDVALTANKSAKAGLVEMGLLFSLLRAYNVLDKVREHRIILNGGILINSVDIFRPLTRERVGLLHWHYL